MAPEGNIEVASNQPTQITTDESVTVDANRANSPDEETIHAYPEAVAKLLTFGEPEADTRADWPDYLATGITVEHIPDLLRMVADPALRTTDQEEEDPKYWAAVHAWRALGQLQDVSAVEPLLQQTEALFDNDTGFTEWAIEELPEVYEAIGPAAIPVLTRYSADPSYPDATRINALTGLLNISKLYPEQKEAIVAFFAAQLELFAQNSPEINGYLISNLTLSQAKETLPLIRQVFADGTVDTFLIDLDFVEVAFGLKERSENPFFQNFGRSRDKEAAPSASATHTHHHSPSTRSVSPPKGSKNKATKKAKAKMEKKSRKQNHGK